MQSVLALGSRRFVRQLFLGGAGGRVVGPSEAAEALRSALADPQVALVLLEEPLAAALPRDAYRQAFLGRESRVVALGATGNEALRRRILQVLGADLLSGRKSL